MNRFLWKHPNLGVLIVAGSACGVVVLGGMAIDHVASRGIEFTIALAFFIFFGAMALAGNRHLS
jgi:hypothetical protein